MEKDCAGSILCKTSASAPPFGGYLLPRVGRKMNLRFFNFNNANRVVIMKVSVALVLSVSLLLTACASRKWVNANDSSANYASDSASCGNEAIRLIPDGPPTARRTTTTAEPAPRTNVYNTNCSKWGDETNCTTTGTTVAPRKSKTTAVLEALNSSFEANESSGSNAHLRKEYSSNCLTMKGWSQVRVKAN